MDCNFLDHCPILLRSTIVDRGLKSFRVLDCWFEDKSFRKVVRDCWTTNSVNGFVGFFVKGKDQGIKADVKSME